MTNLKECHCSLAIRALGDGCEVCNPALAAEVAADNLAASHDDFERHFKLTIRQHGRYKDGTYRDAITEARWQGWQAREQLSNDWREQNGR